MCEKIRFSRRALLEAGALENGTLSSQRGILVCESTRRRRQQGFQLAHFKNAGREERLKKTNNTQPTRTQRKTQSRTPGQTRERRRQQETQLAPASFKFPSKSALEARE